MKNDNFGVFLTLFIKFYTTHIRAIPRCRTYVSDTYFMPGAPTRNENYIKLLLFHTHHLTVSCGTFEYFMSFTHIGYEPI